jgi:sterol desaturase/sphingolipid hydroxylase (fatty acid hydroxylase superfamily)
MKRVSRYVERNGLGAAYLLTSNPVARVAIGVVVLDYGLYIWHVLTHKVPFLWRFHLVHHIDLDLDASTAIRFHFGEMLLSIPWRVAQIRVAGASLIATSIWQTCLLISILFHHSNVRLPINFERRLRCLIATPRLHGIHHRPEQSCLNSNWSSGLSIWDIIHRTHCWREDEQQSTGVPNYQRLEDVTLRRCLLIPFSDSPRRFESVE